MTPSDKERRSLKGLWGNVALADHQTWNTGGTS